MKKILFVHNTAMWYRRPFFKRLSEIYDVKFVFTHIEVSKEVYGVELSDEIEGFEGVNYKVLKNSFGGITFGLIKELLKEDYDVIVSGPLDFFCFIIAKLRKKPFIIWHEGWDWQTKKTLGGRFIASVIRFIFSHSDAFLVPGSKHKEYTVSLGVSPDKAFIMPNVSNILLKDDDHVNKEKLRKELNIENKKVVLYVGRLVKQKGVEYLINAFAKLRNERDDIILIIIGRGECRDELESISKNLDIEDSIYFMDYVENERLAPYYLLCDVCVMPSTTVDQADAWGFIINEAMYFGKPVIATDAVGAAFDMIKDGVNGSVVPEKDSGALYEAMKMILSDPVLEKKMGKKSKRIIEEGFRYENMSEGFMEAVESVLGKRRLRVLK